MNYGPGYQLTATFILCDSKIEYQEEVIKANQISHQRTSVRLSTIMKLSINNKWLLVTT